MELSHLQNGFIFTAWVSGIGLFFSLMFTSFAIAEREDYSVWLVILSVILGIILLISGFMAAAL